MRRTNPSKSPVSRRSRPLCGMHVCTAGRVASLAAVVSTPLKGCAPADSGRFHKTRAQVAVVVKSALVARLQFSTAASPPLVLAQCATRPWGVVLGGSGLTSESGLDTQGLPSSGFDEFVFIRVLHACSLLRRLSLTPTRQGWVTGRACTRAAPVTRGQNKQQNGRPTIGEGPWQPPNPLRRRSQHPFWGSERHLLLGNP